MTADAVVLRLCGACGRPVPRSERWCSDGCAARAATMPSSPSRRRPVLADPLIMLSSGRCRPLWPAAAPQNDALAAAVADLYPAAVLALPPRQQAAWILTGEPWNLTQTEIARRWGVSQPAVAKLLRKAKARLEAALRAGGLCPAPTGRGGIRNGKAAEAQ